MASRFMDVDDAAALAAAEQEEHQEEHGAKSDEGSDGDEGRRPPSRPPVALTGYPGSATYLNRISRRLTCAAHAGDEDSVEQLIDQLRQQLQVYPTHYDTHVQLIAALRVAQRTDELRHARTKFSELYPLSEGTHLCKTIAELSKWTLMRLRTACICMPDTHQICGSSGRRTRSRWPRRPRTGAA